MKETLVGIRAKLMKPGMKSVDLAVHSYWVGRPSPCVVVKDRGIGSLIGGPFESLEEAFQIEVAEHPGYLVTEREDVFAVS
jgi:hypothetical protein